MKDHWSELARSARLRPTARNDEEMPFGFAEAVLRRLARAGRENPVEAWVPLLRPALGLAFATAFVCVLLQVRTQGYKSATPDNLLVETENLIRLAVLE
jgi:hypothetical protein